MNEQIKPFKTVEQIAKKHRLDVSFIEKQLKMGEKIEHEHTKNHELAREIALQHLDEIPDYYTRLKKMESDAKKFKDVKEETKSGDETLRDWFRKSSGKDPKTGRKVKGWVQLGGPFAGAPCARQPGQTSTPKCGSSKMAANLSPEEEEKAFRRKNKQDPNQPEKKNAAKPTNVRTEEMDLQEKEKSGKKDACYTKVKSRYSVWPSAYASGALVKCRKVGAANWGTKTEETHMHEEERYCPLCNKRETRSECSYGEKAWDRVSVKDQEYSMARSELKTIHDALKRLEQKVGKGEGNLEAWVQSKITKAADYIDTAADYVNSGEMEEDVTIEDADGNTFAEVVDIITPDPIKGFKSQMNEATRMQAQTGNIVAVTLTWRGKYYSLKMFFPQVKLPTRKEISDEIQKVYPGSNVVYHSVSEIQPGKPLIQACGPQGGSAAKMGSNKNYVKPMGEEVEISETKKSEMKCNKPKAEAHGSGETGKSHVVKACEGGKEKLIRFGQLGVKGSPKKEGESEEYASRRNRFKTRHAKNIARGRMSAAYWANKVKW
jgi:hypothetical protein